MQVLYLGGISFSGGRKTQEPGDKPSEQGENQLQQQTQPTYDAGSGIEPGTHWWEASALSPLRHPCSPTETLLAQ